MCYGVTWSAMTNIRLRSLFICTYMDWQRATLEFGGRQLRDIAESTGSPKARVQTALHVLRRANSSQQRNQSTATPEHRVLPHW